MTTTVPQPTLPPPPAPANTAVVLVTPAIAEQMLGHNTHNRPPRPQAVAAYTRDMAAGDWRWTGDPIRFADDGTLLDGQHRLIAIVQSGETIPLLVLRGLDRSAQENIDGGVPRKFSDVLSLRGEMSAVGLAALVRNVNQWESGLRGRSTAKVTNAQLLKTLDDHPELRDINRAAYNVSRTWAMPASLVGLTYWLFASIDQEDADFFMARCADGQNLSAGDPIYELRKVVAASKDIRGQRNQRYLLAVTIKAWNAYRRGDKISQLKFRVGGAKPEQFPEPI